jgi:hypothetical protein
VKDGTALTLRCAPAIVWVKDAEHTLVVDSDRGVSRLLTGMEQVLWDLLALGYSRAELVQFVSRFLDVPPAEAGATILATCREWEAAGLLCVVGERSVGTLAKNEREHG